MKNHLLTLLIGLLAGMEIARWLEKSTAIAHPPQMAQPSPPAKAASSVAEADFEESWVQNWYAARLTDNAAALSHWRRGQTNEAVALLENSLNADLKKAGEYLLAMKKAPSDANLLLAVRQANAYRMEFLPSAPSHKP